MVSELDTDNDGIITFEEFKNEMVSLLENRKYGEEGSD